MASLARVPDPEKQPTEEGQHPLSLDDAALYLDRELSLLEFQRRVLEEAARHDNQLLERVKFLSILFSNLDEFFMVRVAVWKQKAQASSQDGPVTVQLQRIRTAVRSLLTRAYQVWRELELELVQEGIDIRDYGDLEGPDRVGIDDYFQKVVYPVLTPLGFDSGRPFPHISSLSLNLAVMVRDEKGEVQFARVKIPNTLPQLVAVPNRRTDARPTMVWLEQVIQENLPELFPGLEILSSHVFRVTRDAEMEIQELESDDLLETMEEAVSQRRFRKVVRMQVSHDMPEELLEILMEKLVCSRPDVYRLDGPLDLGRLKQLPDLDRPELKDLPFNPRVPSSLLLKNSDEMFATLRREDVLLHHPYDSFQPIVDFLENAARDPEVLAIKITLYRVGRNSPIVESLLTAVEEGKQVAVLMELKARFDEESNIDWAKALESAGVHVVYGLVGLKVHSKVAMVVRKEGNAIRRYVHLGTGNYNPATARLYTDLSLLTTSEEIAADVTDVFNDVTGYSAKRDFRKLFVAPITLRERLSELIQREIEHAREGRGGHLIFKMNSLEDRGIIRLLYEASQAGVKVDLLVRGICCLRPGVPGISENIQVTSIVGRFLEHSRIFYFHNGGEEEFYLGSADLMGRNLDRRMELVFPVEDPKQRIRIKEEILETYLADTHNAHHMNSDGSYTQPEFDGENDINSQAVLLPKSTKEAGAERA